MVTIVYVCLDLYDHLVLVRESISTRSTVESHANFVACERRLLTKFALLLLVDVLIFHAVN